MVILITAVCSKYCLHVPSIFYGIEQFLHSCDQLVSSFNAVTYFLYSMFTILIRFYTQSEHLLTVKCELVCLIRLCKCSFYK